MFVARLILAMEPSKTTTKMIPFRLELFFMLIFLAMTTMACSSSNISPKPTLIATIAEPPTFEPSPSPTIKFTQTPLPSPEHTVQPTNTPIPSITPTTLPTPTLTPEPCQTPGQMLRGQYQSQIAGTQLPYQIYLPPCYGQDGRSYPTLYVLHGGSLTERHWDNLGLDEAAEEGILSKLLPPMLIVFPSGGAIAQNTSGGPYSFEGVIVNELIPFIEANFCASPSGSDRAIGGISRGGYWALEIAFRFPGSFASVGGHSVALLDTFAGPDINPQATGINRDLGDLRIYLDIGADDWLINNIRRLHEDMATAGRDHTWVLNEGKHEDAYWAQHLQDYLTWYAVPWSMESESYPLCANDSPGTEGLNPG